MRILASTLALLTLSLSLTLPAARAADAANTVVLELFTSQGCSSCPAADTLIRRLGEADPSLVPLAFHVDYWDYLGWKDPYSAKEYTQRQYGYSRNFRDNEVYTPELVVNGLQAVVGSAEGDVKRAIAAARNTAPQAAIRFVPHQGAAAVEVTVAAAVVAAANQVSAEIWEIRFNRLSSTAVKAGENQGHTVTTANTVTAMRRLGTLSETPSRFTLAAPTNPNDGVAVIVQRPNQGAIIAAGVWGGV